MKREALEGYLRAVGTQIRWRRARVPLLRELSDHISDQAEEYRAQGEGEEAALEQAVAGMGDPEEVGRALDRLHRPQNRWGTALIVLALAVAGLALQQAVYQGLGDTARDAYFRRQLLGILAGCGMLLAVWLSDVPALLQRRGWAVGAVAALWLLPVILGLAFPHAFFARGLRRTPVYAALLLPIPCAALLCRLKGRGGGTVFLCGLGALLLPLLALGGPSMLSYLIAAGAMLLTLGAAVRLGWFSGGRRRNLMLAWGPAALIFAGCLTRFAQSAHWGAFLHPERDPAGAGFLYRLLRGQGPGTEPVFTEEATLLLFQAARLYGRWVYAAVLAAALLLSLLLLRRVSGLRSRSGTLLALSALWPLALQAASYLLYNLGWSPFGPLSLPFLSYGIGFLVVDGALAGVLLSVFRMDALTRDVAAAGPDGPRLPHLPGRVTVSLGKGSLSIEYRRRAE